MACGRYPTKDYPSDPDHITTRGAGGDDVAINVWPLCRTHHVERHAKGLMYMIEKYETLQLWLQRAGRKDVLDRFEDFKKEKRNGETGN